MPPKLNEDIQGNIAALIKERRENLQISQELLAQMTGVSREYISRIERRKRKGMTVGVLSRILKALKLPWAELDHLD